MAAFDDDPNVGAGDGDAKISCENDTPDDDAARGRCADDERLLADETLSRTGCMAVAEHEA